MDSFNAKIVSYDEPTNIYGGPFFDSITTIKEITGEKPFSVTVRGIVFDYKRKCVTKGNIALLSFSLSDGSGSMPVKFEIDQGDISFYERRIRNGVVLKMKGNVFREAYDKKLCLQRITGIVVEPSLNA